jgi:dTDP-4-amino-4,6-dideoxygalactose transaminase
MENFAQMPLASSTWDNEEINALHEVIHSGFFTMGPKVQEFERLFADYHGSRFCVMVNSGSSANFLMVAALFFTKQRKSLQRGDEVIVPAVSWSTTYSPLYFHGLKARFVDIDPGTLNIDPDLIEKAITSETKAIFAVNLLGNSAEYKKIQDICDRHDLILLEDNCESLGSRYLDRHTGTFGLVSSCSSFFSHHLSTMEGGLILTDDEEIYQILLSIRAHGWTRNLPDDNLICQKSDDPFYESFRFILPGYNVRPLEMSGALGITQMKKLGSFIEKRRANYLKFKDKLEKFDFIEIQEETGESSWFGFAIMVTDDAPFSRDQLVSVLTKRNIECRPIVAGNILKNEMIEYFEYSVSGVLTEADRISRNGLFIGNQHTHIDEGLENLVGALCQITA